MDYVDTNIKGDKATSRNKEEHRDVHVSCIHGTVPSEITEF